MRAAEEVTTGRRESRESGLDTYLAGGDTLAMFSDGVVEAFDADGNEFGEERLVDLLREGTASVLSADLLATSIVTAVQRHSGPQQSDDLTVIVVRGRGVLSSEAATTRAGTVHLVDVHPAAS